MAKTKKMILFRFLTFPTFLAFFMVVGLGTLYFLFRDLITFEFLAQNKKILFFWVDERLLLAATLYCCMYIVFVSFSVPFATVLTVSGGFLFGAPLGSCLSSLSATLGATLLFLIVKSGFHDALSTTIRKSKNLEKIRIGIERNIWTYLILIRLIPIIPFWMANIAPALIGVKILIYVTTTLLGILPATILYSYIGSSIGSSFDGQSPDLAVFYRLEFLLPVAGLIFLSAIPAMWKKK